MNHNTNMVLVLLVLFDMLTVTMVIIPSHWEGMWTKANSSLSLFKSLFINSSALVLCWVQPDLHCPVLTQEDIHTLAYVFVNCLAPNIHVTSLSI